MKIVSLHELLVHLYGIVGLRLQIYIILLFFSKPINIFYFYIFLQTYSFKIE